MGLFNRSKQIDKLKKYFENKNINCKEKNDKLTIEIFINEKGITLSPYFDIDEENDYFSIIVNIKEVKKISLEIYNNINLFNINSKYFTMKVSKENIIYLEYNTIINDNICDIFEDVINSLTPLSDIIVNI